MFTFKTYWTNSVYGRRAFPRHLFFDARISGKQIGVKVLSHSLDRFPTHAEQFNQNINSQGFGSANLARHSILAFRQYIAVALRFGLQAVDLRTHRIAGHYDARQYLSPATVPLYEAVCETVGQAPADRRPYIRNDNEQSLSLHIQRIAGDIAACGRIPARRLKTVVTDYELATMPNSGHFVPMEKPQQCAQIILDFVHRKILP